MNDRFKFRIWYEPERKMMLFNNPTLIDGEVMEGGLLFKNYDHSIKNVHECKAEDFKLMQSTGLKDKNGKLIFEGDIVKFKNNITINGSKTHIAVVEHNEVFNVFMYYAERIGFYTVNKAQNEKYDVEVIGNIYENPDLLQECV